MEYGPEIHNELIPNALDLGFYYSDETDEVQVAKISQKDRTTHFYVVGATGSGKTKFLEFLIRQDIMQGNGFGVIDPHGDLIEDIKGFLAYYYAETGNDAFLAERIVLIDPTDPNYTVTFNPIERIDGVSVAEQASELISSFRKIWADSWGIRMEDLLRNTLIALGETELTLCELPTFLTSRPFRSYVLEHVTNPTTLDYFQRFNMMTDRSQITWIEPVMNKINAFLADERMRQMFSAPKSSFQMREIMDTRKHLLIKLDKGKLKGASDLLGSLFMAKIQMTAFSRSGIPAHKRTPFYLYIDEFQNFATESFEVILSEARKYGLSLVMAHQSLSQIPESLRSLILASAGIQVYFRVNRHDAQILAKEAFRYSGFEVKREGVNQPIYWSHSEEWENKIGELQHLQPRTCFAKHKIQGGIIELYTVGVEPAAELFGISDESFQDIFTYITFGEKYLRLRSELLVESIARKNQFEQVICGRSIEQQISTESVQEQTIECKPSASSSKPLTHTQKETAPKEKTTKSRARSKTLSPANITDPTVEREHRRLQHLIKRLAEQHGYKAIIEEPTSDGQGRVDVGLEREGQRIACEISVTTTPEHELGNIRKCLLSGYDFVIVCSEQKTLKKIRSFAEAQLSETDQERINYVSPDELAFYFEEESAGRACHEDRVKGYRVKVNFQPMEEIEKETKRKALARVFIQSSNSNRTETP